jgi:flagellar export protein FliJ
MRRFKFRFESVERARKAEEEGALRGFSVAHRAYSGETARLETFLHELSISLERREGLGIPPVPVAHFRAEDDFISGTKVRIAHAEVRIRKARRQLERAFEGYLAARRRRMTVEKLRDRDRESYLKDRSKAERKIQDEIYVTRARFAHTGGWEDSEESRRPRDFEGDEGPRSCGVKWTPRGAGGGADGRRDGNDAS